MYVHPITRQTCYYATPIECGNFSKIIIEVDPDSGDTHFYTLTPKTLTQEALQMFKPTQIKNNNRIQYIHSSRSWYLFKR